jgi:hypothetical protein
LSKDYRQNQDPDHPHPHSQHPTNLAIDVFRPITLLEASCFCIRTVKCS